MAAAAQDGPVGDQHGRAGHRQHGVPDGDFIAGDHRHRPREDHAGMEVEAELHAHEQEGVTEKSASFDDGKRERDGSRTRLGAVRAGPSCSLQGRAHATAWFEFSLKRSR